MNMFFAHCKHVFWISDLCTSVSIHTGL